MNGNFDQKLTLIWANGGVAVSGPVENWEDDEKSASIHVTISQGSVVASGHTGNDVPHGADKFMVAAEVHGGEKLAPGPATATGWAFPRSTGRDVEVYQWADPVTLTAPGQSAADLDQDLSRRTRTS
jgi:hypothetical protein